MGKKSNYKPLTPAVDDACKILFLLASDTNSNKTLTDICRNVNMNKSKAFTILNTLKNYDLIVKDQYVKTYSLGPSVVTLSRHFLDHLNYIGVVSPFIKNLADETNSITLFCLISGYHVFVITKFGGDRNIGLNIPIGHRLHLTLGASGKSIVAFMPKDKREEIFKNKRLFFYGDPSRMDIKRLENEIAECKQKGYAIDIGEITTGVNFISAPVFDVRQQVIGCVMLMGNYNKSLVKSYGLKTANITKQISSRLGANIQQIYSIVKKE
jgi:DNA-binding IclR family transcriptional regulator